MQPISIKHVAAVAVGGAVGASLRWGIDLLVSSEFWALMSVNLMGSFLIGWFAQKIDSEAIRLFAITGLLGSFTSMSAVILLISPVLNSILAGSAILITFLLAPGLAKLGMTLSRKVKL